MGMNLEQDLRLTSDEMLRMVERLRTLEMHKRQVKPGTERFQKLAEEVEDLAASLFERTQTQERLAGESVELRDRGAIDPPAIEEMRPVRELHLILNDWRDAERRLALAQPGSDEASDRQAEVHRLRQEYRRAAEAAWRQESSP